MESLNPCWLSIELNSIDADVAKWSGALLASYQASLEAMSIDPNFYAPDAVSRVHVTPD